MEEDIHTSSKSLLKPVEKRLQERLKTAIDTAQERIDYEAAHNQALLKALDIVKKFIKTKGRVCYGGTAMNAILPPKKRFYDPDVDLPDYDFFTPAIDKDIEDLTADLKAAGFKDVYHRVGMHEGTKKILVNFVPIADMSVLSPDVYHTMWRRATIREGIRYTDPDILRMMMYLELSRPKGEVERWEKVYERLQLVNSEFPPRAGRRGTKTRKGGQGATKVPAEILKGIANYCIEQQRILFTGPLDTFYKGVIDGSTKPFPIEAHSGVIGFLSPSIHEDAKAIKEALGGNTETKAFYHNAKGELVPEYYEIRCGGTPVCVIFKEVACHSFLNFSVPDGRSIAVASLDTLITLYYAIGIFTRRASQLVPRIFSMIPKFIELVERNRRQKSPAIPAFPLVCRGYQKGYATLLREKVERIQREKAATKAE